VDDRGIESLKIIRSIDGLTMSSPKSLIINSPSSGRRGIGIRLATGAWRSLITAGTGYEIFDTRNNTRRTEPLVLANSIRERVEAWRAANNPGVTSITHSLLDHWRTPRHVNINSISASSQAIETLIWWVEARGIQQGIHVPGDGGAWERLCSKMATGSGRPP